MSPAASMESSSPAGPSQQREEVWRLANDLIGRSLPSVELTSCSGGKVVVRDLTDAVLYFYPGGRVSPMEHDTPMVDAVFHRAFRDRLEEIAKHGFSVFAVSTQAAAEQNRVAQVHSITHPLLADPECQLANALGLPTFPLDEALWYQRLTLITCAGLIRRVFFPVLSARQNPLHVLKWIRVRVAR